MNRNDLENVLNIMLSSKGYAKKRRTWTKAGEGIIKIVNLQKSNFGNTFYVNFGYVINEIPLNRLFMHVFNRISSQNPDETVLINALFDLESDMPDEIRREQLVQILNQQLINDFDCVDSFQKLKIQVQKHPCKDIIPLPIREYLEIEG
jgi:hypothetical protein